MVRDDWANEHDSPRSGEASHHSNQRSAPQGRQDVGRARTSRITARPGVHDTYKRTVAPSFDMNALLASSSLAAATSANDLEPRVLIAKDPLRRTFAANLRVLLETNPKGYIENWMSLLRDAEPDAHIALCILSDLAKCLPEDQDDVSADTGLWNTLMEGGLCEACKRYLTHRETLLLVSTCQMIQACTSF